MALVEGYRSIRKVWTRLDGLNLVVGPNGSGKTNFHRAQEQEEQQADDDDAKGEPR